MIEPTRISLAFAAVSLPLPLRAKTGTVVGTTTPALVLDVGGIASQTLYCEYGPAGPFPPSNQTLETVAEKSGAVARARVASGSVPVLHAAMLRVDAKRSAFPICFNDVLTNEVWALTGPPVKVGQESTTDR
jgi:hypothetical protein